MKHPRIRIRVRCRPEGFSILRISAWRSAWALEPEFTRTLSDALEESQKAAERKNEALLPVLVEQGKGTWH